MDECEYIKKKELDPNQHCLPNPAYTMSEKGVMERVPRAKRQKIHALNIIGRRKIKATRNHIPREVNQWIVAANGLIFFVTQSRGIMFLINIYRFFLIVGILFAGEENLRYLMASAILVLVPFSFVLAMNANIILGRSMDIRDTDIIAAYDWLMSVCCWCEPPSEDTVDEDDGIAVATGATVLGSAAAASSSKPNSSDDKDHPDKDSQSATTVSTSQVGTRTTRRRSTLKKKYVPPPPPPRSLGDEFQAQIEALAKGDHSAVGARRKSLGRDGIDNNMSSQSSDDDETGTTFNPAHAGYQGDETRSKIEKEETQGREKSEESREGAAAD